MTADGDLHALALAVARIEGKLDGALAAATDHETRLRGLEAVNHSDHETRIRRLERALWMSAGAAAAAGGGIGATLSALMGLGTH